MFVLDPIFKIFEACMNHKTASLLPMLEKLDIQLKSDEKDLEGKALLKIIMKKFLPAGDSLLEMMYVFRSLLQVVLILYLQCHQPAIARNCPEIPC